MAEPGSKANHRLEHRARGRAQGGCEQGADTGQGCGAGGTVTFLSCSRSFEMSGEGAQCTRTHVHTHKGKAGTVNSSLRRVKVCFIP